MLDEVVETAIERVWDQVPAYATSSDPHLRGEVARHFRAIFDAVLTTMMDGRPATEADFPITPTHATLRARQGISLADAMRAFRLGHLTLWQSVLDAAGSDSTMRDAALSLTTHVMNVIDVVSSLAAQAFLQAQRHELAEEDRVRRDLLEDLLAGRSPTSGPKLSALRTSGLANAGSYLAVSAHPTRPISGERTFRDAVTMARSVFGGVNSGLAVVRQDEIIGIVPSSAQSSTRIIERLAHVHAGLLNEGISLALGISTIHESLGSVPDAYMEACDAREGLAGRPGVLALPLLTTFDYLILQGNSTTHRLVRPELREFIEHDRARGGPLIETFFAYVANDLNAKVAAEQLHMHVNTAYYRLERIAERTGCDLRAFGDVQQLLIAIRLMEGRHNGTP